MEPILAYKLQNELPSDKDEAKRVQKKAERFEIVRGHLYKKAFSRPLLKCVTPEIGKEVMDDLH